MVEKRSKVKVTPAPENGQLEILITIVNRNKVDYYMDLIQSFESNLQWVSAANGTAKREVLSYLGMAGSEKAVIFSTIRSDRARAALETLEEKFHTIKKGKGVALTIPMSSVIGVSIFGFLCNNMMIVKEETKA